VEHGGGNNSDGHQPDVANAVSLDEPLNQSKTSVSQARSRTCQKGNKANWLLDSTGTTESQWLMLAFVPRNSYFT
jgi:hypothetical protein